VIMDSSECHREKKEESLSWIIWEEKGERGFGEVLVKKEEL